MFGRDNRIISTLANRARAAITKALVESVIDSGEIQLVKVSGLADEVFDDIERLQNYGLSSNPPSNSEAILVNICGSRDHVLAIVVDNAENRPKDLESGETMVYAKFGNKIKLDKDGNIKLNGGGKGGARNGDEVTITSEDNPAFFAILDAAATLAGLPKIESITGKITSSSSSVELPND